MPITMLMYSSLLMEKYSNKSSNFLMTMEIKESTKMKSLRISQSSLQLNRPQRLPRLEKLKVPVKGSRPIRRSENIEMANFSDGADSTVK